jgi:hypothetical protein
MSSRAGRTTISAGALLLVGIILIAVFYLFPAFVKIPTQQGAIVVQQTPQQQPTIQTPSNFNIGVTYQERNAISGAAVSTSSPSYMLFHSNGRSLASVSSLYGEAGVALTAGQTTKFTVYPSDGSTLFLALNAGTSHYIDVAKLLSSNPFISNVKWIPVDSATVNRLVAEINLGRLGTPNYNIDPSLSAQILIPVLPADTSVTLSSPPDQDNLGTTPGRDVYITWEITGISADSAIDLAKLYFTSNQTAALIDLLDVKITAPRIVNPATGQDLGGTYTIPAPAMTSQTTTGVTQYWRYLPGDRDQAVEYGQGLTIVRGASDVDSVRIQLHVKTYFTSANDAASITIGFRLIGADNTLQAAITDTVALGG